MGDGGGISRGLRHLRHPSGARFSLHATPRASHQQQHTITVGSAYFLSADAENLLYVRLPLLVRAHLLRYWIVVFALHAP
jgi:hypothetical protein